MESFSPLDNRLNASPGLKSTVGGEIGSGLNSAPICSGRLGQDFSCVLRSIYMKEGINANVLVEF